MYCSWEKIDTRIHQ